MNRTYRAAWPGWLVLGLSLLTILVGAPVVGALPVLVSGATTVVDDVDEIMKVVFTDSVYEQYLAEAEFADIFEAMDTSNMETTGGRWVEMAHMWQLPAGSRAVGENDYLPVPEPAVFKNSRLTLKKRAAVIEMTGDVMERVRGGDNEAFLSYMERAMPGLLERLGFDRDVAYVGYGLAVKARVAAISGSAGTYTITLTNSHGLAGMTGAWKQFMEGETIGFAASATNPTLRNPGTAQAAKVITVGEGNVGANGSLTVTCDTALAAAIQVNDYILPADQSGHAGQASGVNRELTGLLGGADDGSILATYMNQARSGSRFWQSLVIDAQARGSGILDDDLVNLVDDELSERRNGQMNMLVTSKSANRGYWKSLKTERWQMNPRALTGGKGRVELLVNGRLVPIQTARKLPDETAFGLYGPGWKRIHLGAGRWDDTTGAIWNRLTDAVGRKDSFYAVYLMREELGCTMPQKQVAIRNLLPTTT